MGNYNRDNKSFGRGKEEREMFKTTCASCGRECEVPFRPTGARPVYCNDCFKKNAPQDSRSGRDSYSDRRRNSDDRPMFNAKCDNCGDDCRVPFMPREGKDTLCSKCFEEKGGDPRRTNNTNNPQLAELNEKLDRILELLSPTPKVAKKEKVEKVVIAAEETIVTPEKPKSKRKTTSKSE